MTELDYQQETAERVFACYHTDGWSLRRIAVDVGGMSGETVRKILLGETWADVTVDLRAQRPAYRQRGSDQLDDDALPGVFAAYHDERRSLAGIARDLGVRASRVRKALTGQGEYEEPTRGLRDRYPAYKPRTGRGCRDTPDTPTLTRVFELYFVDRMSLNEVGATVGVRPEFVSDLVTGRADPEATVDLRRKFGDTVRPAVRTKVAVE